MFGEKLQNRTGADRYMATGHNSALVEEDGWLVAAPFAYAGEPLKTGGYTQDSVAGFLCDAIRDFSASRRCRCRKVPS